MKKVTVHNLLGWPMNLTSTFFDLGQGLTRWSHLHVTWLLGLSYGDRSRSCQSHSMPRPHWYVTTVHLRNGSCNKIYIKKKHVHSKDRYLWISLWYISNGLTFVCWWGRQTHVNVARVSTGSPTPHRSRLHVHVPSLHLGHWFMLRGRWPYKNKDNDTYLEINGHCFVW